MRRQCRGRQINTGMYMAMCCIFSAMTTSYLDLSPSAPPQTKWGPAVTGGRYGYQVLPDVLLRNQHRLGLTPTDLVVLINILMHWWERAPTRLPHPRPEQIAHRMG